MNPTAPTTSMPRFFRIALVANPPFGYCSTSWRMKSALEACGHTVMVFTPKMHPYLFKFADGEGGEGGEAGCAAGTAAGARAAAGAVAGGSGSGADGDPVFDAGRLKRFFDVQKLDALVLADGIRACGAAEALPDETAYGVACVTADEAASLAAAAPADANAAGCAFDFAFSFSAEAHVALAGLEKTQVIDVDLLADRAYARTPLANTVAFGPGLLILQDETPDRRAFADALRMRFANAGQPCPIRVLGKGWDGFERIGDKRASLAYALRGSRVVALFSEVGGAGAAAGEGVVAAAAGADVAAAAAGAATVAGSDAEAGAATTATCTVVAPATPAITQATQSVQAAPASARLEGLIALALADGAQVVSIGEPTLARQADHVKVCAKTSEALDVCQAALLENAPRPAADKACNMLEDVLDDALRQALAARADAGSSHPRAIVCAFSFYGYGNFGDEFILETVNARVRALDPAASLVAVSERPEHTLAARGIYAVPPSDKRVLDAVLAHSTAALVTAGLLFDQGIRWTSGKAELLSGTPCPDIPGIAGFAALAAMNGTQVIMHGVGAGPLEVDDSRKLVSLVGRLGAQFAARDQATFDLVGACDVPSDQLLLSADTAFLAEAAPTDAARSALATACFDPDKHKLLAVSLREYEGLPADFASRIAVALDVFLDHVDDTRVVFCVLDAADTVLLAEVDKRMRRSSLTMLYDAHDDVSAMAGMLSLCWSGLSMRYHASVLLMSSGKPCAGIGYLPKVGALYAEMDSSDVLLGMDASADDVYAALERISSDYDSRTQSVRRGREALIARAKEGEQLLSRALRRSGAKAGFVERAFFLEDEPAAERHVRDDARRETEAEVRELSERVAGLEAENRVLAERVAELEQSTSFKLGSTILKAPCVLKDKIAEGRVRLAK